MKIIFLDIDGVLVRPQSKLSEVYNGLAFDKASVDVLKTILKRSNAKIVVTSMWKLGKDIEALKALFKHYGLDSYIYDKIPDSIFYVEREKEIQNYLDSHSIDSFIIIDDMSLGSLKEYVLKTELRSGLQAVEKIEIEKAIEKLNKK